MIRLAVTGCQGRMGLRIADLAYDNPDFKITTLLEYAKHPKINEEVLGMKIATSTDALKGSDVLIDFTTPQATIENLNACVKHGVKLVIGTTGLTTEQSDQITQASKTIPIVFASNMSVGVNILFKIAGELSKLVPDTYSIKISETHHTHKKDAPSGTAKTIAKTIEDVSKRRVGEIESFREGEVVGDHKIIFESPEDIITIEHHAKSRDIFAKGSLVAAKFLTDKDNGLFTMRDVLGIK